MNVLRKHIFRSPAYLLLISLVILFMVLATGGLLDLKMFQLRQMVVRERIMNLELSSRALRNRVHSGAQMSVLDQELGRNILESRVLNNPGKRPERDSSPSGPTVLMTNGVRLLLLKPPLRLQSDAQKLMALKLAFYFERSRRYNQALRIYEKLEPDDFPEPFPAFLSLHTGFVHLALGQRDQARPLLEWVVDEYPATHFDRTARTLLAILDEQDRQEKQARQARDALETADQMFEARNCPGALQYYSRALNSEQKLNTLQTYRRAVCLEETGEIEKSVALYRNLIREGEYSREANRRLLMIGSFYGGGPEIKKQAEHRARSTGDLELVGQIEEARSEVKEPEVFQEIQRWKEENPEASREGIIQDLLQEPDAELRRELTLRGVDLDPPSEDGEEKPDMAGEGPSETSTPDGPAPATREKKPGPKHAPDNPYENIEQAMKGLNASEYRLARPSLKRWPARLRLAEEELEILVLTRDAEGNFHTGDGKTLEAAVLQSVQSHKQGKLLLRLKDGRLFLTDTITFVDGQIQAGPLRIPVPLLHQIAAY
ncbi:MAG: hypothetical protein KDK25_06550 [Leptospiraceae bacterium]|nr:hypothetical protein [Leptospiraceae bacterium]